MFLRIQPKFIAQCVLGAWFFGSQYLQAQQIYTLEVIIFERKGLARTLGSNLTGLALPANYPEAIRVLTSPDAAATNDWNLAMLPANSHSLNSQAAALAANKQMRVLFHQSWRQALGEGANAVAITGGNQYGEHHELEGYLTFNLDKGLAVSTQVWLAQFTANTGQTSNNDIQLPALIHSTSSTMPSSADFTPTLVVPMQLHQKLKLGYIYYLDHPVLGGLIKVQLGDL